ncbi:orotidine 5'-phosphate decarboxylase / HUMPS family protein, partial [Candidatus Aenigmatarchaeota archaeon]
TAKWPDFASLVISRKASIFIDSKLKDIPNTMAGAAREISQMGPYFFNLHASAGVKAMMDTVENAGNST